MKLQDKVKKEQQKSQRRRIRRDFKRKLAVIFIGYPFIFPAIKLKERLVKQKESYWMNRLDRLREKALREATRYIENRMSHTKGSYLIYNSYADEDILYANAFYLRSFFGRRFDHYRSKEHPISYQYHELIKRHFKELEEPFDENRFYEELLEEIEERFASKYQDLTITRKEHKRYSRIYPYLLLSLTE